MVRKPTSSRPHVVYGVTVGASANSLLRGQLAWLRGAGWDVTLVASDDPQAKHAATREDVFFEPVPMTRRITPSQDLQALVRWMEVLRRLRPTAVNVSTPKAGLLGGLAAFLCGIPKRLYVVRGLRLEGTSGPTGRLLWLVEWLCMQTATDVIFVSRSLSETARGLRLVPRGRSWIIGSGSSNGVDAAGIAHRTAAVNTTQLRRELGIPAGSFVVGFIGRIAADKGLATLVSAIQSLPDPRIHLLAIGPTEDLETSRLLDTLGPRVHRVAWTEDVWGHLPALDVLALPTHREGFPNVVLEAAAAGVPSITTRATGAIDSVRDNETGFLIDVGDSVGLASKITQLSNSPALRERLGRNARARVRRDFRPQLIWAGIEAILADKTESIDSLHSAP